MGFVFINTLSYRLGISEPLLLSTLVRFAGVIDLRISGVYKRVANEVM